MNSKGVNFAGANIMKPGAYVNVDASAMVPSRAVAGDIVGYIGPSDGGIPGKVYDFASFDDAKKVLRGGPVLSYLSRIFQPSSELPGASLVRFIRAGSASRASYTVNASLTLSSLDAGRLANGITFSIDAGTADSAYKVRSSAGTDTAFSVRTATIGRPMDGYKRSQVVRHGLTLTSSVSVTGENINTIVRDVDGASGNFYLIENGAVVASMPFGVTTTVRDVAAWVNSRTSWKAAVVGDYDMPAGAIQFPLGVGDPGDVGFDANGAPVNTTAFLTPAAGVGALAYLFNRYDAQIEAAVTSYTNALPVGAVSQASFTGGTGSGLDTMSSDDVTAALAVLGTVDVQSVFLQSHDPALQQLVYQHVVSMRTITAKKYRIFYAGFNGYEATGTSTSPVPVDPTNAEGYPVFSGETWVDVYAAAIRSLDGPVVLCANGTTPSNPLTGLPEQLHGLGFAAQLCGLAAGNAAVEPLTNKSVISQGLEYPVISDSDLNTILDAGGTVAYYDQTLRRTVVLQALTTYQGGANVQFRKLQGLRVQDQIKRDLEDAHAPFVGYPMDLTTAVLIKQACAKKLDSRIRSGANPTGYLTPGLVNGSPVKAWDNLKVTGDGIDAWNVDVEAHPVGESDFILVNCKLTPVPIQL